MLVHRELILVLYGLYLENTFFCKNLFFLNKKKLMKKIKNFLKISVKKCASAGVHAGAKNSVRAKIAAH